MGLITGLLTLPLAPVRGTTWLADKLREQAENELYDEAAILRQFTELEMEREAGTIDDEAADQLEHELFDRLMLAREIAQERGRSDG